MHASEPGVALFARASGSLLCHTEDAQAAGEMEPHRLH